MNVTKVLRSFGVNDRQIKYFRKCIGFQNVTSLVWRPRMQELVFTLKKGRVTICYDMSRQTVNGMIRLLS